MRSLAPLIVIFAAVGATSIPARAQPVPAPRPAPRVTPPQLVAPPDRSVPTAVEAQERGRNVLFELEIDDAGHVTAARVVTPSGSELERVLTARALGLKMEPARRDGVPIAARIRFLFQLDWPTEGDATSAPKTDSAANEDDAPRAASADASAPRTPPETVATNAKSGQAPAGSSGGDEELVYEAEASVEAPTREVTRHSLRGEALTKMPGTRGDALRAVEVLPGVSRPAAGDGAPILRGASSFESLVLLDGSTIPLLYHFQSLTSTFSSRLLQSVDMYPSNFSVRYGRVHGGVVAARSRSPRRDRLHALADVSLLDSSVLVEAPIGDHTGVALAARRSNIDFYFEKVAPSDSFSVVAAPLYWDYQALVEHELSSRHTLRLKAYGSRDQLELFFAEPVAGDPSLRGDIAGMMEFHHVQGELKSRLGPRVEQDLSLTLGRNVLSQRIGPEIDARLETVTLAGRGEWKLQARSDLSLTAGVDVEASFFDGTYRGSRPPQLEGDPSIGETQTTTARVDLEAAFRHVSPAFYAELGWLPATWVRVVPGVRLDYFELFDSWTVDPRLAVRMEVTKTTTLKSGVGLFTQAPLYYQGISEIGNPELEPERALHASVGVEQRFGHWLEMGAEGFAKRITQRIVATTDGNAPFFVNDGIGRVHGIELSAKARPDSDTFAYLAYTLSRSERRDHADPWRLFDYDQTHNLVAALGRDLGAGWEAGARFRWVTGNPRTPVVGSAFDASTGVYRPLYGAINSERNPTFYQLDLSVEKTWALPGFQLTAYLDLQNATNAANPEGVTYSYDYSDSETTRGLPLFPNIGLRGEL